MSCTIIKNKKHPNKIDRVLAPNGKESILYQKILTHLSNTLQDFPKNQSVEKDTFLFNEEGVKITAERNGGTITITDIKRSKNADVAYELDRVLNYFDSIETPVTINKNIKISRITTTNLGFNELNNDDSRLYRKVENVRSIPSEKLKRETLKMWSVSQTPSFKRNFDTSNTHKSKPFKKVNKESALETSKTETLLNTETLRKKLEKESSNVEVKTVSATIAPYFKNVINSEDDVVRVLSSSDYKNFIENAVKTSKLLGLPEPEISENIGGFQYEDGTDVKELSATFHFNTNDTDSVDLFSMIMGDVGLEWQEGVISANYVSDKSEANALETEIEVVNLDGTVDLLNKVGLSDFSIDRTKNAIRIYTFEFHTEEQIEDINNKVINLIDELHKQENYVQTRSVLASSRYFDSETRREAYKQWITTNPKSDENGEFYNVIEQALKNNEQGRPYETGDLEHFNRRELLRRAEGLKPLDITEGENMSERLWVETEVKIKEKHAGKKRLDVNGEPFMEDILSYLEFERNNNESLTTEDIYTLKNSFPNITSASELYEKIQSVFFKDGYFNIDKKALLNSELYNDLEKTLMLENADVQKNTQKLFEKFKKAYLTEGDDALPLNTNNVSEELVEASKTHWNAIGKAERLNPADVESDLLRHLGGVKTRSVFDRIVSRMQGHYDMKRKYESDPEFADRVFNKYSNKIRMSEYHDINGELEYRNEDNFIATFNETLRHSDNLIPLTQDVEFLREVYDTVWVEEPTAVKGVLSQIEDLLIDYNIDVVGLSEKYNTKSKQEIINVLDDIVDLIQKVKNGVHTEFDMDYTARSIAEFMIGEKNQQRKANWVLDSDGLYKGAVAEVYSEKTDAELFEKDSLVKLHDNVYTKVLKEPVETLYEKIYEIAMLETDRLPKEMLPDYVFNEDGSVSSHLYDIENKQDVKYHIKQYFKNKGILLNDSGFTGDVMAEQYAVYKYFRTGFKDIVDKNILNVQELGDRVSAFTGNFDYLTTEFLSDVQNLKLKNKKKNTPLYNNLLKYLNIDDRGVTLVNNNESTIEQVSSFRGVASDEVDLVNNLQQLALISKHKSLYEAFVAGNDQTQSVKKPNVDIDTLSVVYANNPDLLNVYSKSVLFTTDNAVTEHNAEPFIKGTDNVYVRVGDTPSGEATIYVRVKGISNKNYISPFVETADVVLNESQINTFLQEINKNKSETKPKKHYNSKESSDIKNTIDECD